MDSPIYSLPDDCLCHVMSFTSPRDIYNFSLASTCFRSIMDSDVIWKAFLPSDYAVILSRAVDPIEFTSKKGLFFKLSENHVLIDGRKMSFGLERSSAAKCYMISTRLIDIDLGTAPRFFWRRSYQHDSRFLEGAIWRICPCLIRIIGKINGKTLSSKIRYGAYLVYKLRRTCEDISYSTIGKMKLWTSVTVGTHVSKNIVFLESSYVKYTLAKPRFLLNNGLSARKVLYEKPEFDNNIEIIAKKRSDGWIELETGTFYIDEQEGDVEINLLSIEGPLVDNEIIVQGIEIRPKH